MEAWMLWPAVCVGAGFGILIAMLLNAKRDAKERGRRLAELESANVDAGQGGASPLGEGSETASNSNYRMRALQANYARNSPPDSRAAPEYPFFSALQAENARIKAQLAELKNDRERDRAKIKRLESERSRLVELERTAGELQRQNAAPTDVAELEKERARIQQHLGLVRSAERLPELGQLNVQLERENSRLMAEVAELRKERDAHRERVQSLETVEKRWPEMERQMAELMSAFKTFKGDKPVS